MSHKDVCRFCGANGACNGSSRLLFTKSQRHWYAEYEFSFKNHYSTFCSVINRSALELMNRSPRSKHLARWAFWEGENVSVLYNIYRGVSRMVRNRLLLITMPSSVTSTNEVNHYRTVFLLQASNLVQFSYCLDFKVAVVNDMSPGSCTIFFTTCWWN